MTRTDESKNPEVGAKTNSEYSKTSMSDKKTLIKKLMEAGKEIFTQQNFRDVIGPETTPIMLPPCPMTQFIDRFPSKNHTKAEATAAKQQAQYEGEVKVFHALERLEHPLFIMHSFKYTHQQYALFVDHQCKRRDIEEEGETDFVAVQDDLIAIYEVKAVEFQNQNVKTVFERNYKKSREQLEKTCTLIKGICRKTGSFEPKICKYTVFTNLDRNTVDKITKYSSLDTFRKSEILLKEDLELNEGIIGIGNCFKRDITISDIKTLHSRHLCCIKSQVLWTLLGIWCADEKNEFSKDKWDLGRIINRVDKLLRNANISNKPEGPKSSKVKGSPSELKQLGILCLTEEQKEVFYSKSQRIVINGPAGSGKTVLILGKIIQLARKSKGLIVLMVSTKLIGDWFEENLQKSGISSVRSLNSDERHEVVIEVIEDYWTNKSGIVFEWAIARMIAITQVFELDAHVFIDDFHAFDFVFKYYPFCLDVVHIRNDNIKDFWQYTLSQLRISSEKTFWVCYDTLQSTFNTSFDKQCGDIEHWQSKNTVLKLSSNLRNSYEIANFLQFARNERLFNIRISIDLINILADINMPYKPFDVQQDIGHFIHGPSPRFHWVDLHGRGDGKSEYLTNFLTNKVTDILSCTRVAIIHDDYGDPIKHFKKVCVTEEPSDELKQQIEKLAVIDPIKLDEICLKAKETVFSEFKDCKMDLQVFHMDEVISAEWPAVIGIVKLHEKCNIALDLNHNDAIEDIYKNFMRQSLFSYEYKAKQDPIDRLLAKINAIVSRGRAYCALICVIDENEPLINTKDVHFIHHFSQEYIDATVFRCYGNNIINKILFGELETRSKLPVCDPIQNLTREQLQNLINNISIIEKAIRLPSGKIMQPCVLASKVAESYGLEVPVNADENRQWRPLNFNDEQVAIQFRNEKKIFMKPSIQRLIHFPTIKLLSVAKQSYYTEQDSFSQRYLEFLEQAEIIRLPNNLSAKDRCILVEELNLFFKHISDDDDQKLMNAFMESLKKEDSSWKLFRSLSPENKYKTWVVPFAGKRILKFRTVE